MKQITAAIAWNLRKAQRARKDNRPKDRERHLRNVEAMLKRRDQS